MYYVLWVGTGNEARTEQLFRHLIPENLYGDCFYPVRHLQKKIRGTWKDIYERLIPGYLFITTENIHLLYEATSGFPAFLTILGKTELEEGEYFLPLSAEEESWLNKLVRTEIALNKKDKPSHQYLAELSGICFNENDQIEILSGPLKEMQGKIKKINLHKRIAEVEVDFMNTTTVLYLGIEILKKV